MHTITIIYLTAAPAIPEGGLVQGSPCLPWSPWLPLLPGSPTAHTLPGSPSKPLSPLPPYIFVELISMWTSL